MKKILYSDIDGVLLNFSLAWEKFIVQEGYAVPHQGYLDNYYRLSDAIDIQPQDEADLLNEFITSGAFFNLPAINGAPEALQYLYERNWEFVAITACPHGIDVSQQRKRNLEDVLKVPFRDVHITGLHGCKKATLESFPPSIWVDDMFHNALVGHELGYQTFLMNKSYNRHHDAPMMRINDWNEILEKLCAMEV